jgi:glycosyltransferase involved in cell wall biosynthesis
MDDVWTLGMPLRHGADGLSGSAPRLRGSVCFVSETGREERPLLDPSVRYRCFHPAELLSAMGLACSIYSAKQFHAEVCLDFDVFVFHRPNISRRNFVPLIEHLRRLGRIIIADYDDLIFGTEDIALVSSAVRNGTLTPEKAIRAFEANLGALRLFDRVTVSTEPLAEQVRRFHKGVDVRVVPNFVPPSMLEVHARIGTARLPRAAWQIGYFAGTKSHDKDFPLVAEALHRVLAENAEARLMVVGPVALPVGIASLPNVMVHDAVNYLRLPSIMSMCSTVIAPLEASEFNACKSRVKFLEAALSGCRLVATPIPDMRAVGEPHVTFASDTAGWYEALSHAPPPAERLALAEGNLALLREAAAVTGLLELAGFA